LLEAHGVLTIDADRVGREALEPTGEAFDEVAARWPQVVRKGEIDRGALAEIVFNDPAELRALESVTHPHIFGVIRSRVKRTGASVVVEMPLLGRGLGPGWERAVVDARDDSRLKRAIGRGMDEVDARARMKAQPTRSEWLATADVVIPNHGGLDDLVATVATVARLLL
jgi:dephospho-CoA kinase